MALLVIGNAAVDRVLRVDALPRPGESVLAAPGATRPGGKGFNQAVAAARAGAETRFLTVLGTDADALFLEAALSSAGLSVEAIRRDGPTDASMILVAPDGENVIATTCAAADAMPAETAIAAAEALGPGDLLLMQGNLDGALTAQALAAARRRGARAALNPSPARPGYERAIAEADVLIVNELERERIAPGPTQLTLTTLGARGVRIESADGPAFAPAVAVEADDTTGAGDAFAGAFCAALALGCAAPEAAERAVAAAASWLGRVA
jgi:ribokinase